VTGDFTEYLRPSSQLAKYLRPFGIKPTTVRTLNGVAKGYRLDDFLKPDVRPYLDEGPVADW
jgi:hypothetical protein